MANPEQGPQQQGIVGQWQTVSLVVPDFLEPVREAVDAFFSFLIQILNILLTVLELLKVFLSGLLDPLIALIEQIRDLIESLLNDLRQLGIYIHGDFYILEGPDFQALKGGYLPYEGRMVARLQDTSDPNRPDISDASTCIAVFLFVQADIRGVNRIVQLIKSILALFNRKGRGRLNSAVTNVQATYGYDGATIFSYNKGFFRGFTPRRSVEENIQNPYNAVNLTWQLAPIPGAPFPGTPILPPAGFLVEFSTLEQPIKVVAERVIEGSAQDMGLPNQPSKTEVVDCLDEDGNEILLRGGAEQIRIEGNVNWNDAVDFRGEFKSDAVRVYGIKNLSDQSPIALDLLKDGDRNYLQKTFFVPFAQNLAFPGKGYGATFLFDDMPYAAEFELNTRNGKISRKNDTSQPERFFVRVRAVSRTVEDEEGYQFLVDQTALRDREGPVLPLNNGDEVSLLDAGPPSAVTPILFPDASTELYLRAVAEALAILVLSRSDIPVVLGKDGNVVDFPPKFGQALANGLVDPFWSTYEDSARLATGLEDLAKFLMIQLTGRRQVKKYFNEAGASLPKFRRKLFINCINLTNRYLTQNLPPLPARQLAVERAEDLLNFGMFFDRDSGEITTTVDPNEREALAESGQIGGSILEVLQDDSTDLGISPNPHSLGAVGERISGTLVRQTRDSAVLPRSPHFFFAAQGNTTRGRGSVDMCPVAFVRSGARLREIDFVRNLIPDSVYEGAQAVLQIAVGPQVRPQEQGWIAFRLFPQGIPSIDRFFDQILALLRSIQAAIESIAESIRRYIEFLQSRIRELQAFLNRLNALIQRLLRFFLSITPAAGLVVVAPGTEGVTNALISSTNKPITPANPQADSYGGGVVLLAGGIPNLALDVFRALFQGDT
jgi:hypothetical protein